MMYYTEMAMKKINILIVDDDAIIRRSLLKMLSANEELSVDSASNAEEVFEKLENSMFHCIVLDYILEHVDGIDMLRSLSEKGYDTPVVMLTGQEDDLLAVRVLQAGAYDYLPKRLLSNPDFSSMLQFTIQKAISTYDREKDRERSQRALKLSEARYRGLIENSPILILRFFPDGHISFVNNSSCEYFNVERADVLGEDILDFMSEDIGSDAKQRIAALSYENRVTTFDMYTGEGKNQRWQIWTIQAIFNQQEKIIEYQCMGEDITQLKVAEREVQDQKRYLQAIIDSQDNMIIVVNRNAILLASISFLVFFGFRSFDDMKKNLNRIVDQTLNINGSEPESGNPDKMLSEILEYQEKYNLVTFQPEGGSSRIFSVKFNRLSIDSETFVVEFSDVTELEERARDFENKANFDLLTRIYNRRKFNELLTLEVVKAKKTGEDLSVIFFDIDHFKRVNDTYGHKAGDYVLKELSSLISSKIRRYDVFCRWGGEEFLILLPGTELVNAAKLADKLRKHVMSHDFTEVERITCSFGVASFVKQDNPDSFVNRADGALYRAKESGRNRVIAVKKKQKDS